MDSKALPHALLMVTGLRAWIPWWFRMAVKLVLSRLPVPYRVWERFGLFAHGRMRSPEYALNVFLSCAEAAGLVAGTVPALTRTSGATTFGVLEIGPGDSLYSVFVARAMGADRCWLVDSGDFADHDVGGCMAMAQYLKNKGFPAPWHQLESTTSADAMIRDCGGIYLTGGVASLKQIPNGSIDYCFSNAALEHVARRDFDLLASELHRVLRPTGVALHRIDLKDHLGGGLNHLRFLEQSWESPLFSRGGFYTNRLRFSDIKEAFVRAGFRTEIGRIVRWEDLPTPRDALAAPFRSLPDDELLISEFDLVLRRT